MIRFARRRYLTRSVAALGGVLGAACFLADSLWPGTGPPPRRPTPSSFRVLYGQYGPGPGPCTLKAPWVGRDPMGDHTGLTRNGFTLPLPPPSRSATRTA